MTNYRAGVDYALQKLGFTSRDLGDQPLPHGPDHIAAERLAKMLQADEGNYTLNAKTRTGRPGDNRLDRPIVWNSPSFVEHH